MSLLVPTLSLSVFFQSLHVAWVWIIIAHLETNMAPPVQDFTKMTQCERGKDLKGSSIKLINQASVPANSCQRKYRDAVVLKSMTNVQDVITGYAVVFLQVIKSNTLSCQLLFLPYNTLSSLYVWLLLFFVFLFFFFFNTKKWREKNHLSFHELNWIPEILRFSF